ncbi:MAG: prenyltransferase/squalene oxidase repeat-containing protein [Pirellulales bacterium]
MAIYATMVCVALLLLFVLLIWLSTPSLLVEGVANKPDDTPGGRNPDASMTLATDNPGDDISSGRVVHEDSNQAIVAPVSDNVESRDEASGEELHDSVPGNVKADSDSESATVASVEQVETASLPRPSGSNDAQQSAGNQFFTLGTPNGRPTTPSRIGEPTLRVTPVNDALSGRTGAAKQDMLKVQGGTAVTEAAVKLGLEWLAKNQMEDGLWSLTGPYSDGGNPENTAAASAMALLAFQGAGHTHRGDHGDAYTKVVARGSSALLKHVFENEDDPVGRSLGGGYAQAMCTIALCELYGMTNDRKLRPPATKAIEYCLSAQSSQGGWRYIPRQDSDTSVTGWFVMGLQSGRMAKLKVPNEAFEAASAYLNAAANDYGSRYSYQPGVVPTPSMTAEALLCRQYLGWQRDDRRLQDGAQYLLANLPAWNSRDVYYWYYATQVCHHMGGDVWQQWNNVMRELLPANQVTIGAERGSWDPHGDRFGAPGGRLYVTCLSLYILEVYYRYLPLYTDTAVSDH